MADYYYARYGVIIFAFVVLAVCIGLFPITLNLFKSKWQDDIQEFHENTEKAFDGLQNVWYKSRSKRQAVAYKYRPYPNSAYQAQAPVRKAYRPPQVYLAPRKRQQYQDRFYRQYLAGPYAARAKRPVYPAPRYPLRPYYPPVTKPTKTTVKEKTTTTTEATTTFKEKEKSEEKTTTTTEATTTFKEREKSEEKTTTTTEATTTFKEREKSEEKTTTTTEATTTFKEREKSEEKTTTAPEATTTVMMIVPEPDCDDGTAPLAEFDCSDQPCPGGYGCVTVGVNAAMKCCAPPPFPTCEDGTEPLKDVDCGTAECPAGYQCSNINSFAVCCAAEVTPEPYGPPPTAKPVPQPSPQPPPQPYGPSPPPPTAKPVPQPTPAPPPQPQPYGPPPTAKPVLQPTPAPPPQPQPYGPPPTAKPVPQPTPAPAPQPTAKPVPQPTPAPPPQPQPYGPPPTAKPVPQPTPAPPPQPQPYGPPPTAKPVPQPTPAPPPQPTEQFPQPYAVIDGQEEIVPPLEPIRCGDGKPVLQANDGNYFDCSSRDCPVKFRCDVGIIGGVCCPDGSPQYRGQGAGVQGGPRSPTINEPNKPQTPETNRGQVGVPVRPPSRGLIGFDYQLSLAKTEEQKRRLIERRENRKRRYQAELLAFAANRST